jgi:hypothetical protein
LPDTYFRQPERQCAEILIFGQSYFPICLSGAVVRQQSARDQTRSEFIFYLQGAGSKIIREFR